MERPLNIAGSLLFLLLVAAACSGGQPGRPGENKFKNYNWTNSPDTSYVQMIREERREKDQEFSDTTTSPIPYDEINQFDGLKYYPINLEYRVKARFERTPDQEPFVMATTGDKAPEYVKYGELHFLLKSHKITLNVYQNLGHLKTEEYKDYLFLPFSDATSGKETYGGGRYIDLHRPLPDTVMVDFNQAYNPWCVYNYTDYDCPIPPKPNRMNIAIRAGEKMYDKPGGKGNHKMLK